METKGKPDISDIGLELNAHYLILARLVPTTNNASITAAILLGLDQRQSTYL